MKQRQIYLDNVCGLLIIHMIFICHQPLFCNYTDSAVEFVLKLLSFFMAWFFFKAGMVYKERPVKEEILPDGAKRRSQLFYNKKCSVSINPDTGIIIQCQPN